MLAGELYLLNSFITSAQEVMFSLQFVSLCWQDYAKTTEPILLKLGGRVGYGPRKNPLTSGADAIKGADPGFCFWTFFNIMR